MNRYDLEDFAKRTAASYNLPPEIFLRLINTESGFNPNAVSPKGAVGLTQLMPATAQELGVDASNVTQNIEGGARYLRQMLDKYNGNMELALAAYNAGPGNVDKFGGVPPFAETQDYLFKMLGRQPAQQPDAPPSSTSDEQQSQGLLSSFGFGMNVNPETGMTGLQNITQALDPLLPAEQRMGQVIRDRGKATKKTIQGNNTARLLDTLPGGKPYAAMIRNGADGQAVYLQYLKDQKDGTLTKKDKFDATNKLRQEFIGKQETKEFSKQVAAFARIMRSAEDPTAAGDLALIFNYMKLLDPGSTVRESEFATASNAGGIDDRTRSLFNYLRTGERLSKEQRKDFLDRSVRLYRGAEDQFGSIRDQYVKLAEKQGLPVDQIIIDSQYVGGDIPEINENISIATIPPKPTKDAGFDEEFVNRFPTQADWENFFLNMNRSDQLAYVNALKKDN